jgi:hypothetical protein
MPVEREGTPYSNALPSGSCHDVEILGETYKGKPLINLDDYNPFKVQVKKPRFVRRGHFRLMDLAPELRIYIYQFLLPYNLVISHVRSGDASHKGLQDAPRWRITPRTKNGEAVLMMIGHQNWSGPRIPSSHKHWSRVETQLFLVNKEISNEARGKLPFLAFSVWL